MHKIKTLFIFRWKYKICIQTFNLNIKICVFFVRIIINYDLYEEKIIPLSLISLKTFFKFVNFLDW